MSGKMDERFIADDNVCAWPDLTRLDDERARSRHLQSTGARPLARRHRYMEQRRGVAAPGEPPGDRMNVAAGCATDGDLLVIASGWTSVLEPGTDDPQFGFQQRQVLDPRVCRSADGGRSWERADSVQLLDPGQRWDIRFGGIVSSDQGLAVSFYSASPLTLSVTRTVCSRSTPSSTSMTATSWNSTVDSGTTVTIRLPRRSEHGERPG